MAAFSPNPATEGEMEVQIPMDLHGRYNRPIPYQVKEHWS